MKVVQAGILVCLMAITGLLFAIYRQQAALQAMPRLEAPLAATVAPPPETLEPMSLDGAEIETAEAPRRQPKRAPSAKTKPRPVPRSIAEAAPKPKPAASVGRPEPEPELVVTRTEPAGDPEPQIAIFGGTDPQAPEPVRATPKPAENQRATLDRVEDQQFAEPLREEPAVAPREPRVVTIPAGERLTVRIDNTLSTSRNRADDTFFATLDEALVVDGLIIADKGARLQGRIVESQRAGRLKGLARLTCELTHLDTDDGQRVEIRTSVFALDGPRTRGEDMKRVAMGAGTGAVLGAIFGGGKGAAIGAASGAGAGAGTAAATRGEPAVIEPETRLDFRLTDGVTITERL